MGNDNHVAVSHKLGGFQGRVGGRIVVMKKQRGACSNFLLISLGKLRNWSQRCLWAHGLFGDGLHGWVLEVFQYVLSFWWCLVTLKVHHLQLTLDRPWNVNVIQKPPWGLKNVLQSVTKHFKGFVADLPIVMPSITTRISARVLDCWVKEFSGLVDRRGLRNDENQLI
jgi:hypothetical protein